MTRFLKGTDRPLAEAYQLALLDHVGHPVRRLTRTAIGPVALARLAPGELRELTLAELGELLDTAELLERRTLGLGPWQSGQCEERPSSTRTRATTCSSGWPRWSWT